MKKEEIKKKVIENAGVEAMKNIEYCALKHYPNLPPKKRSKAGSSLLPVYLQTLESKIFVDGIYSDLTKQNFDYLTKHDSIICSVPDRLKALLAMHKYLSQLCFYNIR